MSFVNINDSTIKFNNSLIFENNIAYDCNLFSIFQVYNSNNKFIEFHKLIYIKNNELNSDSDLSLSKQ